jgi:hypothetical protein
MNEDILVSSLDKAIFGITFILRWSLTAYNLSTLQGWRSTFVTKIRMQKKKNIGNFTTLLKPHNIGIHLKGIETSFFLIF